MGTFEFMNTRSAVSKRLTHVISWVTVIGLSFFIPSPRFVVQNELYVLLNSSVLITAFYVNYYVLVPRIYIRYSLGWYLLSAFVLLVVMSLAYSAILEILTDPSLQLEGRLSRDGSGRRFIPSWKFKYFRSMPLTVLTLIGMLISSLIALQESNQKKELEIASVKASLLDQELNLLRSQINPHFLFNALNTVYSMSITRTQEVGPVILKLSEMLRYTLYDIGEEEVSINKEISYISNYIELLKLKDPESHNITFTYTSSEAKINPMILIVFVENSFKHGDIAHKDGYVSIDLTVDNGELRFEIKNSIPQNVSSNQNSKGIGIENAKKRLALVYPDRHELEIHKTEAEFNVKLTIQLDA